MTGWVVAGVLLVAMLFTLWRLWRLGSTKSALVKVAEEATIAAEGQEARAIDPEDPPRWIIYRPQGVRPAPMCTCHGIPLVEGQKVLLWPIPGHPSGGVDLICERAVAEAKGE